MFLKITNWETKNRALYLIALTFFSPTSVRGVPKIEANYCFFHIWDSRPWYYIDRKVTTFGIKPETKFTQGELNEVLDGIEQWGYFKYLREIHSPDNYMFRLMGSGSSEISHIIEFDTITKKSWIEAIREDEPRLFPEEVEDYYDADKPVIIHR